MKTATSLLLITVLAVPGTVSAQQYDDDLDSILGVTIDYYDVHGTTVDEIRASMNMVRPRDPFDGRAVDALSRWSVRWRWRGDGNGNCLLATTQVSFTATVTMPRLANDVSPTVAARWHDYMVKLRRHEAGHIDFAFSQLPSIEAAVKGAASCADANPAGGAALAVINTHDRDYDRDTDHGRTKGAVFP